MKKKILVVDDDSDTRSLLCTILEEEGYGVVQAADGMEALECLKKEPADMIVTDRTMPRLDGMGLLSALRDQRLQLPVLMISAYGEESFWGQAIGLGAVDYLLKPFDPDEVIRIVQKAFRGAKKK